MRWIGIDYGAARVGVAVTDETNSFVLPYETISAAASVETVVDLASELDAHIVVGWPLELSGEAGRATARVARFVTELEQLAVARGLHLEVHKRDERLTTGMAEALLDEAGVHGRKRKGVVDQLAAVQILEAFLTERAERGEDDD